MDAGYLYKTSGREIKTTVIPDPPKPHVDPIVPPPPDFLKPPKVIPPDIPEPTPKLPPDSDIFLPGGGIGDDQIIGILIPGNPNDPNIHNREDHIVYMTKTVAKLLGLWP